MMPLNITAVMRQEEVGNLRNTIFIQGCLKNKITRTIKWSALTASSKKPLHASDMHGFNVM